MCSGKYEVHALGVELRKKVDEEDGQDRKAGFVGSGDALHIGGMGSAQTIGVLPLQAGHVLPVLYQHSLRNVGGDVLSRLLPVISWYISREDI